MKSLYESLLDDFDTMSASSSTDIKKEIRQFLKDNYKKSSYLKISRKPNDDGYYEVDCSKYTTIFTDNNIMSLTNNLFIFVNVNGTFDCSHCNNLTSLEGAPQKVGRTFDCSYCKNLTSIEGAPKNVRWNFYCYSCDNLTSLKGAPNEVGRNFICYFCINLTSLEGAPK